MAVQSITHSIAVTGSGGTGAITVGNMLLQQAAKNGLFGLMRRSVGPQIRGGESAALLRLSSQAVSCPDDSFGLLVAFDWNNADRFALEIPLNSQSLIITDPKSGKIPDVILESAARVIEVPMHSMASEISGGRINMVGLGLITSLLDMPAETAIEAITSALSRKGEEAVNSSISCFQAGFNYPRDFQLTGERLKVLEKTERWNISGNEASGLGALQGGVRFVAAYPITPASEILEWLSPRLEKIGGTLLQAEDELASINMIVGASFGGVSSLTATSGPGLSLMSEGIGLAVASEIPVVVIDVTRGGPSTGIPTKSEQSDLNIALYGLHGDAPHLVVAPQSVPDCIETTRWAVQLSETLQTAVIVLSDQFLGQSRCITSVPESPPEPVTRQVAEPRDDNSYQRYALTDNGVSPMAIPGTVGCGYTADGLEHKASGQPSSLAMDHHEQLNKRLHKLTSFDFKDKWAEIYGEGATAIVTWGSSTAAVQEAAQRLEHMGQSVKVISIRLLAPAQITKMENELSDVTRLLVVEQSQTKQFYHYLKAHYKLPENVNVYAQPGPLTITPGVIVDAVQQMKGVEL